MEVIKLLNTFENLLYEIATWLVFLPKTFVQVVFKPKKTQKYLLAEWGKAPSERFKDHLSPVFFWLFIAVLPTVLLLRLPSTSVTIFLPITTSLPWDVSIFFSAITLLITPLLYASVLLKIDGKHIEKETLKRLFYLQCLYCAPYQASEIPLLITQFAAESNPGISNGFIIGGYVFWLVGLTWFNLVQIFIFKHELYIPWWKSTATVLITFLVNFLLEFLLILLIGLVSIGLLVTKTN